MTGPWSHPAAASDQQLLRECRVERTRRSGPGGQHRNKVETAIVLLHEPTAVRAEASERRSQAQNQQQALFRLRLRLALEIRQEAAEPRPPLSPRWKERSSGGRIRVNPEHADYPPLLAEALDHLASAHFDLKPASQSLGVTASQLTKFLKAYPPGFEYVNQQRKKLGYHPLH